MGRSVILTGRELEAIASRLDPTNLEPSLTLTPKIRKDCNDLLAMVAALQAELHYTQVLCHELEKENHVLRTENKELHVKFM